MSIRHRKGHSQMAIIVLLEVRWPSLRHRIYQCNKKKLYGVRDEYLLGIFEDHVIIWNCPACWVIFQGL